jgi:hypothetical protein
MACELGIAFCARWHTIVIIDFHGEEKSGTMADKRRSQGFRDLIQRPGVENYLLVMLISFGSTVSITRLFLYLTGYPQIATGDLHIAHVLWGGLFLFAAVLMLLIFANRWMSWGAAIFAGVGFGLFIDEVGKYITQNNDYFFPYAAPIIYAFFLICTLLYLQTRRQARRNSRKELSTALDLMRDVVDRDLDWRERQKIVDSLQFVIERDEHQETTRLAKELLEFALSDEVQVVATPEEKWKKYREKISPLYIHDRFRTVSRIFIGLSLAFLGLASLFSFLYLLLPALGHPLPVNAIMQALAGKVDVSYTYTNWLFLLISLRGLVSVLLFTGLVLLLKRNEALAASFAYYGLLIYLLMVDLLLFYYYQFSTIFLALFKLVLLLVLLYYRRRYLQQNVTLPSSKVMG